MVRRLALVVVLAVACLTCLLFSGETSWTRASHNPAARTTEVDPASRRDVLTPANTDQGDLMATAGTITSVPTAARVMTGRDPAGTRLLRFAAFVLTLVNACLVGRVLAPSRESHLPARHTLAIPGSLDLRGPPRLAASH